MLNSPSVIYDLSCGLDQKSNWPLKFRYTKLLSNPSFIMVTKHAQWKQETYAGG